MKVKVTQSCMTLCDPMDYAVRRILQARILEWVAFPFSRSSQPRIEPRSPALQADSLPAEPQGKPKNTGVSNLSLLQWIFPTQESNQGSLTLINVANYDITPLRKCYLLATDDSDCLSSEVDLFANSSLPCPNQK